MNGSTIRRLALAALVFATAAGAGGAAASNATAAPDDGGKAFTDCMRAHDLPDFPEVTVSESGLINLSIDGERVDVLSQKYGAAVKACEPLLPAGTTFPAGPPAPAAPSAPARPA
ncbi:hypothetical protein ACFFV7_23165 [Nonomuraea spiralis]|uniref:Uncharacterized protein n=1 Tax=Nonomuraea spiralis TaxID=46182 RepID=A0ABV5II97_9ACTN|nr:hypothetical protein [Nonomuraea spiralis]GGS95396.1 hypothetical protein GCM10010176_044120 [Nonomuraea spiralis]